jgi:pimeloyl-ACP methyl ester carboxylesterase
MGGYITLAFAEKYPELLTAFGLFHSSAFADSEEKKETRRKGIAFIKKAGAFEFLKTSTPNMYSPKTKEQAPALIEEHLASVRNFSAEALVLYYEAMMQRPDRTGVLRQSHVPVLFVMGRHDNAVPLEDALKQCHLPPLSYIHLLENSGHTGMKEEPETANQLLTGFVSMIETVATV